MFILSALNQIRCEPLTNSHGLVSFAHRQLYNFRPHGKATSAVCWSCLHELTCSPLLPRLPPAFTNDAGYGRTDPKSALRRVEEARKSNLQSKLVDIDSCRIDIYAKIRVWLSISWTLCRVAMDKLRRVLSGQEGNEEQGLTTQVPNATEWQ